MAPRSTPTAPPLEEQHIQERFVRASGPGGQNVNKTATAVELRFDVRASSLEPDVQARLASLAGQRMQADGALVIDSRTFRTQLQNRKAARERLAALIGRAMTPPKKRTPTKVKAGERQKRLTAKKQRGAIKALRGRSEAGEE